MSKIKSHQLFDSFVKTVHGVYPDAQGNVSPSVGVGFGIQGKTTASEGPIPLGAVPYAFTPTANGSYAYALTAATAETVFIIRKGTTQIGTLTFGAGSNLGVFVFTGFLIVRDSLNIMPPAIPDSTLSDIHGLIGSSASGAVMPGGPGGDVVGGV